MKNQARRRFNKWEWMLFATPSLCLLCVGLFSRLKTIELPRQQIIESGKPLLTMTVKTAPDGTFAVYHAVRLPNGTYKIYWIQRP